MRHTKSGPKDIEVLRKEISDSRTAFPNLDTEILETVEQGDMVAIRWRSQGTHTGSFMGVPPTERVVSVTGASFCRFADDLLAEEWVVWDPRELLSAMKIWTVGTDGNSVPPAGAAHHHRQSPQHGIPARPQASPATAVGCQVQGGLSPRLKRLFRRPARGRSGWASRR